jgi:general secretion pathway protein G
MAIIAILLAVAIPIYRSSVVRAQEAVLKDDLFQLRSMIDQYTLDKQKAPQSLDDLVTAGYLHSIPKDPFTNSSTSWRVDQDNSLMSVDEQDTGISDVHSGSDAMSTEGTAYSSW